MFEAVDVWEGWRREHDLNGKPVRCGTNNRCRKNRVVCCPQWVSNRIDNKSVLIYLPCGDIQLSSNVSQKECPSDKITCFDM